MESSAESAVAGDAPPYAELHCLSNFTFLRGASHPHELVDRAHALGYEALALTDECSMAGIVRAHAAARACGLKLIIGSEFRLECGLRVVGLARSRRGYAALCRLITRARRAADKGSYRLTREDLLAELRAAAAEEQLFLIWLPEDGAADEERLGWLQAGFGAALRIAVELVCDGLDKGRLARRLALAQRTGVSAVACGDVHMHVRERRRLQDAVTAIRWRVPLDAAGWRLAPNGERHLRPRTRLVRLHPRALLAETVRMAEACHFNLDELRYQYPHEIVPPGESPASYLRRLTEAGALRLWPQGVPAKVRSQIEHELQLIAELGYEPFFLTVYDIVEFAKSREILCQGRGSAANSVVCYCIGVTAVNPAKLSTLFERFVSRERNEPPDIDIDFEHERREEVIQYVYRKYGRRRAALAATVICYRARSALRDLAMALAFEPDEAGRLAGVMQWWDGSHIDPERVREAGFDPQAARVSLLLGLARELIGFPRHLSQHVGGFVISEDLLEELVPIENAAMPERTVIQWDKDDLDDLGLLKVDLLGLGMLTAIRRCFDLVAGFTGERYSLVSVPEEDPAVYDMICRGDTVGVFQIESRAQMAMLPRLRPRRYYDLVIEVAIVRPGPIQGDMVHPYLRRRAEEEEVSYPSEAVRGVLERTLGVPIFQEQVMQLAIVAAGFTPGEADQLRRAMAAWKRRGGLEHFEQKLIGGMRERGYEEAFARQIFQQILGFGEYGFPESHAASFALLVYVSAWLKCHHPAAFTAALLNSLPMGFYAPAQLVRDARSHGVEIRAVDVVCSDVQSTLERGAGDLAALRLGFDRVKSLSTRAATTLVSARTLRAFASVQDLGERAQLDRGELEALAAAGALAGLSGHRHRAYWGVAGYLPPLPAAPVEDDAIALPLLPTPTEGQDIVADYNALGLTLGRHPVALLRERLADNGILSAGELATCGSGSAVRVAGIVITRQRPESASGVTFVTLEDESGHVNIVVWRALGDAQRPALVDSRLLEVRGELQRESGVTHVVARQLVDRSRWLGALLAPSRDFH